MKLLLIEFNEIDAGLIDRGIGRGELPTFESFRASATRHVTDACDTLLEPWVQWVTLHTGVPLAEHGAVQLAQGEQVRQAFVWEKVAAAGNPVWVCGAMNSREPPDLVGNILPDYWSPASSESPFRSFNGFVNACVSRHIDQRHRVPWREGLAFSVFMARRGLRPRTVLRAMRHLSLAAATRTPWRLTFVLEDCQLDLFLHESRRIRPRFGLFFVNSVAHLQHNYWQEAEPERFDRPAVGGRARHQDAIAAGYRHLDRVLAGLLELAGNDTTVILCSALGQRPYQAQDGRGSVVYRVSDLDRLVQALSLPKPRRAIRTMADSFTLEYDDPRAMRAAVRILGSVHVGQVPVFAPREHEDRAVLVEVELTHPIDDDEPVVQDGRPTHLRLGQLLQIGHHKSGEHHAHGLLWVRGEFPALAGEAGRPVPLTAIAPAIERHFDCEPDVTAS